MNTRKGISKFKNFEIQLDSGCISTISMGRLVGKLYLEQDAVMQWHTQARNITTNLNVKVYLTLTELSATNVVTWNCHVDDSTNGRYNIILGRDILT